MAGFRPVGTKPVATVGATPPVGTFYAPAAASFLFYGGSGPTFAGSGNIHFAKIELAPWLNPPAGAVFSKIELAPWLNPPAGAVFAKIELGVWLVGISRRPKLLYSSL